MERKLGPLPLWGWAALAVGAFVVVRRLRASAQAAPPQTIMPYGSGLGPQYSPSPFNPPPVSAGLPVSAISTTNGGGGTTANAPSVAPNPYLINGTGLVSSAGVPPGGKLPR